MAELRISKRGRVNEGYPKWEPTAEQIAEAGKLAQMQCTLAELAAWFDVGTSTIDRRMRDCQEFSEAVHRGWAKGSISFKRLLWKHAEKGNPKALGLLGSRFGMDEKHTHRVTVGVGTIEEARIEEMTDEELDRLEQSIDTVAVCLGPSPGDPANQRTGTEGEE